MYYRELRTLEFGGWREVRGSVSACEGSAGRDVDFDESGDCDV